MTKSKSKSDSAEDQTRPKPLVNNYMESSSVGSSPKNSLFGGEKVKEYFFFLPGGADLYITQKIKTDDKERQISSWPLNDLASQTSKPNHSDSNLTSLFGNVNPDSKGIPAGNFFKDEQSAYDAATKAYRIKICIIKLSIPSKLIGKITEIPDKKQRQIFPFELMPYVQSITEFNPHNKFREGILYQKTGSAYKMTFQREKELQTSLQPPKNNPRHSY